MFPDAPLYRISGSAIAFYELYIQDTLILQKHPSLNFLEFPRDSPLIQFYLTH